MKHLNNLGNTILEGLMKLILCVIKENILSYVRNKINIIRDMMKMKLSCYGKKTLKENSINK